MQSSSLDSTPPAPGPPVHELNTGERRWLAELYEANYGPVVRLCTRLLRNGEAASGVARVAVVVGALGLGRRGSSGGPLALCRALAMAVLPRAGVVVIQTSSTGPGAGPPVPAQSAIHQPGAGAGMAATGSAHDS